jgi:hypothetical protein
VFLKDHKGFFSNKIPPKKESFGLFLLMLQQIILEISSHPSMTYSFISFLESLLKNFSINDGDEYIDWNFVLLKNISSQFSTESLMESEISLSEKLNEISRKKFNNGQIQAKYWLRLFHLHQTVPDKLSKAILEEQDISKFVEKYFSEQIPDQIENRVLKRLSTSTESKQLMQLQNPFSNFKIIHKITQKTQNSPNTNINPILHTQDMLTNISTFLIFLNKTLFLLSENEELQKCLLKSSSKTIKEALDKESAWDFDLAKITTLKRSYEEDMQAYLDSCEVSMLNMFLDKLESFLDVHKQVDRDYLKRVLQMLLFTKYEFMKGISN